MTGTKVQFQPAVVRPLHRACRSPAGSRAAATSPTRTPAPPTGSGRSAGSGGVVYVRRGLASPAAKVAAYKEAADAELRKPNGGGAPDPDVEEMMRNDA